MLGSMLAGGGGGAEDGKRKGGRGILKEKKELRHWRDQATNEDVDKSLKVDPEPERW